AIEIEKARGPFKVSAPAERAALAAVTEDRAWVAQRVAKAIANRERFIGELRAMGLGPLSSSSNFVLVPVDDSMELARRLRAVGIAVRAFTALPAIGDAVRITVGPWEIMEATLTGLRTCV